MRKMGPVGDVTLAGVLTLAVRPRVTKAFPFAHFWWLFSGVLSAPRPPHLGLDVCLPVASPLLVPVTLRSAVISVNACHTIGLTVSVSETCLRGVSNMAFKPFLRDPFFS